MRGTRRWAAAAALVVLASAWDAAATPLPPSGGSLTGMHLGVGEVGYFGLANLGPGARVRSARVLGVPDGLEVVGVYGVPFEGHGTIGALTAPLPEPYRLLPVGAVRSARGWTLVVAARATRAGSFRTMGVALTWASGLRGGVAFYPDQVEIDAR